MQTIYASESTFDRIPKVLKHPLAGFVYLFSLLHISMRFQLPKYVWYYTRSDYCFDLW